MRITECGASVSHKLDIGYVPYMEYLDSLNGAKAEFGVRKNSATDISMWAKSQVEEGEDPEAVLSSLVSQLDHLIMNKLRSMYPECFLNTSEDNIFDERTVVTTMDTGDEY